MLSDAQIIIQKEFCPQNHPCPVLPKCPVGAISQENPFSAPKVDDDKCKKCGLCTKMCRVYKCEGCK